MAVEILDETHRFRRVETLCRALEALLAEQGLGDRDVSVVLLDDAAMAERNRRDRGVDGPTDVLSYPTTEPDDVGYPAIAHLGDVFIDLDVAARQATDHGHDLMSEMLVLAAHGVTHLRGFDHDSELAWRPFTDAERRILVLAATEAPDRGRP
ncbi:MAG: rRNA maturation RNase YbeY [Deinococcales bacterium]